MPNHRLPLPPLGGSARRILWLALALSVAAAGCAASGDQPGAAAPVSSAIGTAAAPVDAATAPEPTAADPDSAAESELRDPTGESPTEERVGTPTGSDRGDRDPGGTVEPEPTAGLDVSGTALPPAPIGLDGLAELNPTGPRPVWLSLDDIDVVGADVIPVGVNPDLTFEVPPADQVGWYRFGPAPGEEGSAVLAAHIAFNGVDGVFRHLADVEVGAVVEIGFDDGSSQRYRIESLTEYLKDELPDELFARQGEPRLALITCGGDFNRQLSSYESNVVAVAVPI